MNLTECLNSALPDIPALNRGDIRPRTHSNLVGREHIEDGEPVVSAIISGKTWLYQFSPVEWKLIQLCDGSRTCQELAEALAEHHGVNASADDVRAMVERLDSMDFWQRTPLEENIVLKQRLTEERQQKVKKKSKYGDVSHLIITAWDPDRYLDKIYPKIKFVYTKWFAVLGALAFVFMLYVFVDRWSEIGHDTLQFYNFKQKSFWDIVEFWWLSCFALFIHESAHGLTCKHYGGHVHRMGFNLLYLTPAFYTDATEIFVYGGKWERLMTIFWGAWSELLLCAIATPIWWGTVAGSFAHELAYKLMLITGLGVVFFNWNPLIKLDGYFLLTEMLGISMLKEDSTAFVVAWIKRHIWRLPVEVPYVPKRRRLGYAIFAITSGAYSYTLLYVVANFVGNIASNYSPEWGFLFGLAAGYRIFRSRIHMLVRFMHTVYLDKKERVLAWFNSVRTTATVAVLLALVFLPIWRESAKGRFYLEPASRAVIRAKVPGIVASVYAGESESVTAGAPLISLRNPNLASTAGRASTDYRMAGARSAQALLSYANFGAAEQERQHFREVSQARETQLEQLQIASPIAGQLMTPRLHDLVGSYVEVGRELAEVADLSTVLARIYVPESEVAKLRVGAPAGLLFDSSFHPVRGVLESVAPTSSEIAAGLIPPTSYKGISPPNFYVCVIRVENEGRQFYEGLPGLAQIYGERRSLAKLAWEDLRDFLSRKLW
jgi:putative peptide zinc metalloprotease protein